MTDSSQFAQKGSTFSPVIPASGEAPLSPPPPPQDTRTIAHPILEAGTVMVLLHSWFTGVTL